MNGRGKQSLAALMTPSEVVVVRRPDAPLDLTPDETDVWNAIVGAMPADWFARETWPLLVQYCRHTVSARRVSMLIDSEAASPKIDVATMKDLLAMQAKETAALKALAASMRLSQQASYSARGAAGEKGRRKKADNPWAFDGQKD